MIKKKEPKKISNKFEKKMISHLKKDEKKEAKETKKSTFIPLSRKIMLNKCGG